MTENIIDTHIGKKLRSRRMLMGLSQDATARAAGITFQQVQKYEKGANAMNATKLLVFAQLMRVPVSYFFSGLEESVSDEALLAAEAPPEGAEKRNVFGLEAGNAYGSDRESLELMKAFTRIERPYVRRRLADLARALADSKLTTEE